MFRLVEQCFGSARYFGPSGGAAAKFTGPVAGLFPSGQTHKTGAGALQEVIVTDTIPLNPNKDLHKFTVLSVADIFADVIERVHNYKEISSIFFK